MAAAAGACALAFVLLGSGISPAPGGAIAPGAARSAADAGIASAEAAAARPRAGGAGDPGEVPASDSPAAASDAPAPGLPPGRNPVRSALRGVRAFGADAWYVTSSPLRLDRRGLAWFAGTALATAVVHANDGPIQRMLDRQHGNAAYDAVLKTGDNLEPLGYMARTAPFYVGTMAIGWALDNRTLTMMPAQVLESHVIAGGLRNVGKVLVGRRRPFENRGPNAFEFDGGTSFPSGHASIAFELATVVSMHARRWPVTAGAYALATTVAIQRVDSRNHWPSDVIVPAVTGSFIARTVVQRSSGPRTWAFAPVLRPGGAPGVQVVVAF